MIFVDENGKLIKPLETIYHTGKEDFLQVGNFIIGHKNRYKVVSKELDLTAGGGVDWVIKITVDNRVRV